MPENSWFFLLPETFILYLRLLFFTTHVLAFSGVDYTYTVHAVTESDASFPPGAGCMYIRMEAACAAAQITITLYKYL